MSTGSFSSVVVRGDGAGAQAEIRAARIRGAKALMIDSVGTMSIG